MNHENKRTNLKVCFSTTGADGYLVQYLTLAEAVLWHMPVFSKTCLQLAKDCLQEELGLPKSVSINTTVSSIWRTAVEMLLLPQACTVCNEKQHKQAEEGLKGNRSVKRGGTNGGTPSSAGRRNSMQQKLPRG